MILKSTVTAAKGTIEDVFAIIDDDFQNKYQTAITTALADQALLQDLAGAPLEQTPHQIDYLINRFHRQLGVSHHLVFDVHSGIIADELLNLKKDEALSKIASHVVTKMDSPQVLVEKTAKLIADALEATKKARS